MVNTRKKRGGLRVTNDNEIIERLFDYDITFIAMEFMSEYIPLNQLRHTPKYERYKSFAFYELDKLHEKGYLHNDFHYDNVMIHPTYKYFTNDIDNKTDLGRAIIIDFGLATIIPKDVDLNNVDNRLKFLNKEYGVIKDNTMEEIIILDYKHKIIQHEYVEFIENRLNRKIIINNLLHSKLNTIKYVLCKNIFYQVLNPLKINPTITE